jgi:hypothetical protein
MLLSSSKDSLDQARRTIAIKPMMFLLILSTRICKPLRTRRKGRRPFRKSSNKIKMTFLTRLLEASGSEKLDQRRMLLQKCRNKRTNNSLTYSERLIQMIWLSLMIQGRSEKLVKTNNLPYLRSKN